MTVILAGSFRCPPERMEAFRPHALAMQAASRAEPGCISYSFAESVSDPGLLHVFEHFESEEALAFHRASPHMAAWRALWPDHGVGERRMGAFDVSGFRDI